MKRDDEIEQTHRDPNDITLGVHSGGDQETTVRGAHEGLALLD